MFSDSNDWCNAKNYTAISLLPIIVGCFPNIQLIFSPCEPHKPKAKEIGALKILFPAKYVVHVAIK